MIVTIVDDAKSWRRVYIERELVAENHPARIDWHKVLKELSLALGNTRMAFAVQSKRVDDFNLLEEAGGVALG